MLPGCRCVLQTFPLLSNNKLSKMEVPMILDGLSLSLIANPLHVRRSEQIFIIHACFGQEESSSPSHLRSEPSRPIDDDHRSYQALSPLYYRTW